MGLDLNNFRPRKLTRLGEESYWEDGSSINIYETEWDYKSYNSLVSTYTSRTLTDQNDALNACRGVLNMMAQNARCQFNFGLPVEDFHRALLWKPHHENTVLRREDFPSWSWLGWIGRTEHAYWIVDMAGYADEPVGRPRKRLRGLEAFDSMEDISADVLPVLTPETSGKLIRLSSQIVRFHLCLQRKDGEIHTGLNSRSVQSSHAVGDNWTLLSNDASARKLKDIAGEHQVFETTDFFFRAHPKYGMTLETFTFEHRKAEFVLIER